MSLPRRAFLSSLLGGAAVAATPGLAARAQTWAEADPYSAAGVYAKVTVKPFKNVFPA